MIRMRTLHCLAGMTAATQLALLRRTCAHDPYEFYRIDGPDSEPKAEHLGLTIGEMRYRRPESLTAPVTYLVPEEIAQDLLALAPEQITLGPCTTLGLPEADATADPPHP